MLDPSMNRLLDIMQKLRDPENGCPWDKQQTFESIFPYTLEEVHEVGDAIDRANMTDLKSELGDLLFQIVFYAQLAEEQGVFTFQDIVTGISEKMIRRHPHVFADTVYKDAAEQKAAWEKIKQQEREKKTESSLVFDDIAQSLTALQRGQKILNRVAQSGFDWADWRPVIDKIYEEVDEIIEAVEQGESQQRIEEEVGDLFIVITNLARHLQVDSENAARKAVNKFARRYQRMMEIVRQKYPETTVFSLQQMDQGWELVKKEEKII